MPEMVDQPLPFGDDEGALVQPVYRLGEAALQALTKPKPNIGGIMKDATVRVETDGGTVVGDFVMAGGDIDGLEGLTDEILGEMPHIVIDMPLDQFLETVGEAAASTMADHETVALALIQGLTSGASQKQAFIGAYISATATNILNALVPQELSEALGKAAEKAQAKKVAALAELRERRAAASRTDLLDGVKPLNTDIAAAGLAFAHDSELSPDQSDD